MYAMTMVDTSPAGDERPAAADLQYIFSLVTSSRDAI